MEEHRFKTDLVSLMLGVRGTAFCERSALQDTEPGWIRRWQTWHFERAPQLVGLDHSTLAASRALSATSWRISNVGSKHATDKHMVS